MVSIDPNPGVQTETGSESFGKSDPDPAEIPGFVILFLRILGAGRSGAGGGGGGGGGHGAAQRLHAGQ